MPSELNPVSLSVHSSLSTIIPPPYALAQQAAAAPAHASPARAVRIQLVKEKELLFIIDSLPFCAFCFQLSTQLSWLTFISKQDPCLEQNSLPASLPVRS